jgi:RimJ/RimL family protein N-acetyltransferase
LRVEDDDEMATVLADPRLYAFIGGDPPTLEDLHARYLRQVAGRSPDGTQTWHNWIVRRSEDHRAIGTVQATIDDADGTVDIAWLIGTAWQGAGYGSEAARELVRWLRSQGLAAIMAHIHPDNTRSARVAARAGLHPSDAFERGERIWRWSARPGPIS